MTSMLLDLSGKLPPDIVETLRMVINPADALGIPTLVVGAAARDLVLEYHYGLGSQRATRDIDFGIAVDSWEKFDRLIEALVASGNFKRAVNVAHRLIVINPGVVVDIIPFGDVESPAGHIAWPPDQAIIMSTHGFKEAYQSALTLRLASGLESRVVSPAGLALLKLIAWLDRYEQRDAQDLAFVMSNYLDAGNKDRLYTEHVDLIDEDFDYILTGVRLLGRDIGSMVGEQTREVVLRALNIDSESNTLNRLAATMAGIGISFDENYDNAYQKLKILREGIMEGSKER
jgi:predicted nucleotidyltransferase